MADWTEEKIIDLFAKAFKEVVLPSLELLQNRLEDRLGKVEARLNAVEEKLVKIDDALERHAKYYDDHEKRITRVETKLGLSPQ